MLLLSFFISFSWETNFGGSQWNLEEHWCRSWSFCSHFQKVSLLPYVFQNMDVVCLFLLYSFFNRQIRFSKYIAGWARLCKTCRLVNFYACCVVANAKGIWNLYTWFSICIHEGQCAESWFGGLYAFILMSTCFALQSL